MKKLSMLFFALIATMTAWAQKETAAGNTKVNTDFSKYHTFTWAKPDPTAVGPTGYDIYYYEITPEQMKPAGYVYSYSVIIPSSDDATNTAIRDGISGELIGRGYRENEASPDLIIAYQVFDQKAQLHGYNATDPVSTPPAQVRNASDTTTFILEPGTLMISLVDAKTGEMVWNGFSSGLISDRSFIKDEGELKEAVHTIFEKFKHTADKARKD